MMKRALSLGEALAPEAKTMKVAYATFKKWKAEMDKECQTVTWLDCDTEVQAGKRFVTKLRCSTCTKFKTEIVSRRKFQRALDYLAPNLFETATFEIMLDLTNTYTQ